MATLVSVNVGMPEDVSWHGRTVRTGIYKRPVSGPRTVRRLNVDGDGQGDLAGHGGEIRAVMVYQLDSYRHWAGELGRDDLGHGEFGENFTVDGLPDDEVCIGDRYRIGGAVFEVTQPRVTCYRVGLRLGEPRMPSLLVSHRRPGFYFRVITEGDVEAGQEIVKVASGPGGMTVAEVDGLLYLPGHRPERLREAVRIGALSPGWRDSFRTMLERPGAPGPAGPAAAPAGPAWPGFRPLRVVRTKAESRTVLSLWLAAEDGAALPAAAPGQYLTLRLDPGTPAGEPTPGNSSRAPAEGRAAAGRDDRADVGDGQEARTGTRSSRRPAPLVRSYSLSGRPGDDDYRISVKREGLASTFLHTRVHVRDVLQAAAPRGTFTLEPGGAPLVLASAGVGATPVLAMLRAVADRDPDRRVWWLHGARDGREHAFAAEVRQVLGRLPNSRLVVCYSTPRAEDRQGTDFTQAGRLDAQTLASLGLPADAQVYLCGPAAFMDDLTDALVGLGLKADHVHREIFGATAALTPGIAAVAARPPHQPQGVPGMGPAVTFARSGLTVRWGTAVCSSLLELAEACDVPVRWSCRTGVCHTCETSVFSGDVEYDPEPVEAPEDGMALICCSCPHDDIVLDL